MAPFAENVFRLLVAAGLALAPLAGHALPLDLPPEGAVASVLAEARGELPPNSLTDGPGPTAAAEVEAPIGALFGPDAVARAQSTAGGSVRSQTFVEYAADLFAEPARAMSMARWVAWYRATGTNPGRPIDIDLTLAVDGRLAYANLRRDGLGENDFFSRVDVSAALWRVAVPVPPVFAGGAKVADLDGIRPSLIRIGDWAASERDGDFDDSACRTLRDCTVAVSMNALFEDVSFVGFGEIFAIELEVSTEAFATGLGLGSPEFFSKDLLAGSEFFNTGSLTAGTDTAGVTISRAGSPQVPVPGTLALLGVGLAVLGLGRRSGWRGRPGA